VADLQDDIYLTSGGLCVTVKLCMVDRGRGAVERSLRQFSCGELDITAVLQNAEENKEYKGFNNMD
jgi:hypothetical protein